jgi:ubiquinone/menaquinone biosynthesis C-methylase UbiE
MIPAALALALLATAAGALYWLFVVTEGAYLGPSTVRFLYDWGAASYDRVKQFDPVDDARTLAVPLVGALRGVPEPLVLDVATGTGRLPLALLRDLNFQGRIFALDISLRMLEQARRKAAQYESKVVWLWKDGQELPFGDATFHAVSCVEALEFLPQPRFTLTELCRVLAPGGLILTSNRRGMDARLMPGRAFSEVQLRELCSELGLRSVEIKQWQTYYDLVWARKPGTLAQGRGSLEAEELLWCPRCKQASLGSRPQGLTCTRCGSVYPVKGGIVCLEGA